MDNNKEPSRIWIEILSVTSSVFTIIGISLIGIKGNIKAPIGDVISAIFCCIIGLALITIITFASINYLNNQPIAYIKNGQIFFWSALIVIVTVFSGALYYLISHWAYSFIARLF